MKSIIQNSYECFICGTTTCLEKHHCFPGNPNRKHSEEDGLWVYLCADHHRGNVSVHFNHEMEQKLKKYSQMVYERKHTREQFVERYGKNYL